MWVMCEWPRHKVVLTVSITGRLQPTEAKHVRSHGWLPVVRSHELAPRPRQYRARASQLMCTCGCLRARSAWNKLRGMSKEDAMRHYVDGVTAIAPEWFKWEGLTVSHVGVGGCLAMCDMYRHVCQTKYGARSVPSLLAKAAARSGQTEEKKDAPGAGDRTAGEGEASAGGSDDLKQPRSPTDGKPTAPAEADDLDLTSAGPQSSPDASDSGAGAGAGAADSKAVLRSGDGASTTPASGGAGGGSATPQQAAAAKPPQSAGFATPQRSMATPHAPASAVSSTSVHSTVASAELLNNSLQKLRAITTDDAARVARLEQQLFALVQRARYGDVFVELGWR